MACILLSKLIEPNPAKRYSADKVLKHPWITRLFLENIPKTYLDTMKERTLKKKTTIVIEK